MTKPKSRGSSAASWVLAAILILGSLAGGGYYFFVWGPAHKVGTLIVNSNPRGAKITIDGQTQPDWVTPWTFQEYATGPHRVVISKSGYDAVTNSVTIAGAQTTNLNATLTAQVAPSPAPTPNVGTLIVSSNPAGAKITIDGQSQPDWVTPRTFEGYAAGDHQVVVSKPGYDNTTSSVTIEAGKTGNIDATLKALSVAGPRPALKMGTLIVNSSPSGAQISIDGHSDPDWVTPKTFQEYAAGTHTVVVSKDGYDSSSQSVTVEGGKTASLNLPLSEPTGELKVVTDPPGLAVSVDGESWGASPVHRTVQVGEHIVTVKGPRGKPDVNTVTVNSGRERTLTLRYPGIASASTGVVLVRTVPPGASIVVDGQPSDEKTPISFSLPTGHHVVAVFLPGSGLPPRKQEFDLTAEGTTLNIDLKQR
jgi:hypothetical protein